MGEISTPRLLALTRKNARGEILGLIRKKRDLAKHNVKNLMEMKQHRSEIEQWRKVVQQLDLLLGEIDVSIKGREVSK